MRTIDAQQMDEKFCCNDNAIVINVLSKEYFDKEHIPGSINIPLESKDFLEQVKRRIHDKSQDIVVYCAKTECTASEEAAEKLTAAGYENVYDFEGGMKEWREAGHPVEPEQSRKGKTDENMSGACC